jgi:RNA polymerase sigma-70 factor (ECF subfamily)
MRDSDVLENNPHVSRSALEAMHGQVFGWALSRCDFEQVIAEDLVQQAYVELLTGKARFDGQSSLKTFVFAVVQNLSRNRYRRLASRMRLLDKVALEADDNVAQVEEEGDHQGLWQAVQSLPARQRDIVELVFCRDLTIEEASTVMGVATGTGRVHYDRAKKTLKSRLRND